MIRVERPASGVLSLYLSRPERKNAVTLEMVETLIEAISDEAAAFTIILGAVGSFCAGIDLSLERSVRGAVSDRLYDLYVAIVESPLPIVAAVRGHAIGAGAQMMLASDLRVAGKDLSVRFPGLDQQVGSGDMGLAEPGGPRPGG